MIIIKIIVLFLFLIFVEKYPKLKNFTDETKFNVYRSLICLYFTLYSFDNVINNVFKGYNDPFDYKVQGFQDVSEWFMAYIMLDIGKMIWMKNKRWDLYIHHIWALGSWMIANKYDKLGFLHNLILTGEAISIVTGIDAIHMEEKEMDKSKKCKYYRKNVIKYWRLPIWIITLLVTLHQSHNLPSLMFWNGILSSLIMIWLDRFWEQKCDKILCL